MMQLQFFGTSAGTPSKQSSLSSVGIRPEGSKNWFLVDCGEGTQSRILYSSCSLLKIKYIFITHMHGDHVLGLPGLLSSRSIQGIDRPLTIVGPAGIKIFIHQTLASIFCNLKFPLEIIEIDNLTDRKIEIDHFNVEAIPMVHSVTSYSYLFTEKKIKREFLKEKAIDCGIPAGPLFKKLSNEETVRLEDGREFHGTDFLGPPLRPLRFIIGGDNAEPEVFKDYMKGLDLLVHEATFTEASFNVLSKKLLHTTVKQLCEFAETYKLTNLILTHFSSRYHHSEEELHLKEVREEARQHYQGNIFYASDLDSYSIVAGRLMQKY